MKTTVYLVMTRKGQCRTVKTPPRLSRDEIAIGFRLSIPDTVFLAPVVFADITVPESAVITPAIGVEVEMPQVPAGDPQ